MFGAYKHRLSYALVKKLFTRIPHIHKKHVLCMTRRKEICMRHCAGVLRGREGQKNAAALLAAALG
jgi:hypothetical protein